MTEIDARTKAFGKGVTDAVAHQKTLLGVLADPSYAKYETRLAGIARQTELIGLRSRNVALAARVADGSYAAQLRSVTALNSQFERMQRLATPKPRHAYLDEIRGTRRRQQKLEAGMGDGSLDVLARRQREYAKTARAAERSQRLAAPASGRAYLDETRAVRQQQQKLERGMSDGSLAVLERRRREYEKTAHLAELIAKHGERTGRFLARHGTTLEAAGKIGTYAGGAALATGAGLVRSGFQGTVEGNRLALETKMLGRELAGAFKPVIELTTRVTRGLRRFMETLGPAGQNVVMFGGLALSGAMTLRMLGGGHLLGAAARMMMGGGLLGRAGPSIAANVAANAAGSAAGNAATRGGSSAAGAAAAKTAAAGAGSGVAGTAAAGSGPVGWAVAAGAGTFLGSRYAEQQVEGDGFGSRATRFAHRALRDTMIPFGGSIDSYADRQLGTGTGAGGAGGDPRRQVQLAGGGFEEAGSGYDRIASAIATVDAEREGAAEAGTVEVVLGLKRIADLLEAQRAAAERGPAPPLARPGG